MSNNRLLNDGTSINALAELLMKCPAVIKYDEGGYSEAGAIAHAFSDLEESFHTFLTDQLPKLTNGQLEPSAINDLLLDIGEEFRHVLYHINDPRFYEYLSKNPDQMIEKNRER